MGKAEDREMQYEAEVDRLTAGCPGIYTTKQLEDKMRWERTGIDLDAFAAADDFEVYYRRGHITTASIMRMARLTRSQREVFRLTVGRGEEELGCLMPRRPGSSIEIGAQYRIWSQESERESCQS